MALIDVGQGVQLNVEIMDGIVPSDTVFLHGNLASNLWWQPTINELRKKHGTNNRGRAIMIEWRGCGKSSRVNSEAELSLNELAGDLWRVLDVLKVRKTSFVGHSAGGIIGLIAMARRPQLFDRAVLLCPVPAHGVPYTDQSVARFERMAKDRDYLATVLSATIHNNDLSSSFFQNIVTDAFSVGEVNWLGIPNMLRSLDCSHLIRLVSAPVLVLHGKHDPVLPVAGSQRLVDELKFGVFEQLDEQGHSANIENPKLFVEKMTSFLFADWSTELRQTGSL